MVRVPGHDVGERRVMGQAEPPTVAERVDAAHMFTSDSGERIQYSPRAGPGGPPVMDPLPRSPPDGRSAAKWEEGAELRRSAARRIPRWRVAMPALPLMANLVASASPSRTVHARCSFGEDGHEREGVFTDVRSPAVVDGVELDDAVEVDVSDPRADNSHWRQYHQPRWEHGERASAGGAIVADVGTVQPPDGPPG